MFPAFKLIRVLCGPCEGGEGRVGDRPLDFSVRGYFRLEPVG